MSNKLTLKIIQASEIEVGMIYIDCYPFDEFNRRHHERCDDDHKFKIVKHEWCSTSGYYKTAVFCTPDRPYLFSKKASIIVKVLP